MPPRPHSSLPAHGFKHEPNGIQYVEHTEGDAMLEAVCKLGLEGIVSKKLYAPLSLRTVEKLDQNQKS